MATPEDIEKAVQYAAAELTKQGKFEYSSSRIKTACGVENPSANGFTTEEKKIVAEIVTNRLDEAKKIVAALPEIKEARDAAIERQNTASSLTRDYLEDRKLAENQLENGVDLSLDDRQRYNARIEDNTRGLELTRAQEEQAGARVEQLDDQMKNVTRSALGAAIKGDPTDQSIEVRKPLAEKAAVAAAPKESKSFMQSLRSKIR